MATNGRLATRRRIPKLSEPDSDTGRFYASYRGPKGTARRERFTRDRKESEQLYRRWVIEHYDDSADIVIRDGSESFGMRRLVASRPFVAMHQGYRMLARDA